MTFPHPSPARLGRRGLLAGMGAAALGLTVPHAQAVPVATAFPVQPPRLPRRLARFDVRGRMLDSLQRRNLGHLTSPFQKVIEPGLYQCTPDDRMEAWKQRHIAAFTEADYEVVWETLLDLLPAVDAAMTHDVHNPEYALTSHQHILRKTLAKSQCFWDIDGSDVLLMGIGTSVYSSVDRLAKCYELNDLPPAEAREMAEFVHEFVKTCSGMQGGRNPLLTNTALAYSTLGQEPGHQDRIVVGPGLLQAYDELGYGDVAPQMVVAHEYMHHVQYETGMLKAYGEVVPSPEGTRRTELHADAGAAYFCSHPKGMSLQTKRILNLAESLFSTGDCYFDSTGHHGTPRQRRAAALWGAELQEGHRPRSAVLSTRDFQQVYEAKLPELVAPDA